MDDVILALAFMSRMRATDGREYPFCDLCEEWATENHIHSSVHLSRVAGHLAQQATAVAASAAASVVQELSLIHI